VKHVSVEIKRLPHYGIAIINLAISGLTKYAIGFIVKPKENLE
tara:strand:- start:310 stop:438 length:129 start_codon:yes stop_codon:yes gene_type:complete